MQGMTISKTQDGSAATLSVEGRVDTVTAPQLEQEIQAAQDAQSLTVNLKGLEYISSAGLRVLLSAHKAFSKKGGLTIENPNDSVMEIFEVTGFKDILNIKA